ncbi:hypothetical protein SLS56_005240 [Neofusicoccum ribis]|uniref:Succinate dehydrogenase assembly factor 4, mitochondrial n=1 Tax=Neofusicoccum ribis TaxID=45134 RepID=A0ABR3SUX6_9PEZI
MLSPQRLARWLAPGIRYSSTFRTAPSPHRLPDEEQKIFEELQRRSTVNQSPGSAAEEKVYKVAADGEGEELHPDIRRGARPEFEGEVNPKTGEVGGPKNEPLRWGASGDWSFNGRVTDF